MHSKCLPALLTIALLVFVASYLLAQESYVQAFSQRDSTPLIHVYAVTQNDNQETSLLTWPIGKIGLIQLDSLGQLSSGYLIGNSAGSFGWASSYQVKGDWHIITTRSLGAGNSMNALFALNFEDNLFRGRGIRERNPIVPALSTFIGAEHILVSYGRLPGDTIDARHNIGLAKLELQNGAQEWARIYRHKGKANFLPTSLLSSGDGHSLLVGNLMEEDNGSFILEVDELGQPVKSVRVRFPLDSMDITSANQDDAGNIYLAGRVLKDTARNQYNRPTYHGFVAKLDEDFEVQWSKELVAEEFACREIAVQSFPDGDMLFTAVSHGDLPIIAGRLSSDGELLWRRGYEFYAPNISLSEDGSISFLTSRRYAPDGTWSTGTVLAKTLPDGSLPGCPQFTACLELEDMPLPLAPMVWEASPGPILPDVDVEVAPSDFVAEPYCGTPAPPTPYFELPDTLCQGACAALDSLPNALASQAAWKVEGPGGLDTAFTGKTFSWCFDRPGLYLVRQTVWLLGCAEEYEQTVEVLPALELSLGGSRVLCGAPPYALSPEASRPLRSYDWGGGQHSGSLPVDSSGHYRLLASDGHCTAADSLRLVFLRDTLAGPVFEYGPRDTVLCRAFLPYSLEVGGAYPLAYTLDGRPMEGGRAELARAGTYVLGAELHGCPLTDTLRLEADECTAAIYLPTAFSPNGDGINDQWRPLGKDFEALRLRAYGRWGSLLHEAEGAGAVWDGRSQGKPAPNGTYTLVLDYRNTRTGEEGQAVQAVDLVR